MKIPKLDILPDGGEIYTIDDYENQKERGSFGYRFYEAFDQNVRQVYDKAKSGISLRDREAYSPEENRKISEKFDTYMHREIDGAVQRYLIEHNGAVDNLPYGKVSFSFTGVAQKRVYDSDGEEFGAIERKASYNEYTFDMFKTGCEPQNFCYDGEYTAAIEKERALKERLELANKRKKEIFKAFFAWLPFICTLLFSFVMLYAYYTGNTEFTLNVGSKIPFYLYRGNTETISYLPLIVINIIGYIVSWFIRLAAEPNISKEKASDVRREYDAYIKSAEYKHAVTEGARERAEYEALVRELYRVWYERCRQY